MKTGQLLVLVLSFFVGAVFADNNSERELKLEADGEVAHWLAQYVPENQTYLVAFADYSNNAVMLYELQKGQSTLLKKIDVHTPTSVGFSPSGKRLAIVDRDNKRLKLYEQINQNNWELVAEVQTNQNPFYVLFSPSGKLVLVSDDENKLVAYRIEDHNLNRIDEIKIKEGPWALDIAQQKRIKVEPVKKLSWYARARAYVKKLTGY